MEPRPQAPPAAAHLRGPRGVVRGRIVICFEGGPGGGPARPVAGSPGRAARGVPSSQHFELGGDCASGGLSHTLRRRPPSRAKGRARVGPALLSRCPSVCAARVHAPAWLPAPPAPLPAGAEPAAAPPPPSLPRVLLGVREAPLPGPATRLHRVYIQSERIEPVKRPLLLP